MTDKLARAERTYLLIGTGGNAVLGVLGISFAYVSLSDAILLDGAFNLTYFVTGLFTLRIAQLLRRGDNQEFPFGYAFFEPLINGIKGVLVLGVTLMALVDATRSLATGGRFIEAGPAVVYGALATVACWILAFLTYRGAKKTGSPLIGADSENWIVNGAISSAVLAAFAGIFAIEDTDWAFLIPYVDPGLVMLVCLITIMVPIRMAWRALMELLNRAPEPKVTEQVTQIIRDCTADLPVEQLFVRMIQPGRTRLILAHVVLPADFPIKNLQLLDSYRRKTQAQLLDQHRDTWLDLLFTADASFGAPTGAAPKSR